VKSYGMKLKGTVVVSKAGEPWKAEVRIVYLQNNKVMVVARTRIEGAWAAYVDSIAGVSLEHDQQHVLAYGTKMTEGVAKGMFPEFANLPYAK